MRVEELRIGNYTYPFDDINLVDDKTIFKDLIEVTYKDIKDTYNLHPIPLTKEWLLKFGFESDGYGEYKKERYTLDCEYTNKGVYYFFIDDIFVDAEVLYVHQLQNLYFALTGEELKLKYNE